MAGKAKRSILIEILGDAKDYAKSTRQAESATTSFEKKVDAVGKAIAGAYIAKKVIDFGFAAMKAAVDDAAGQKVLATALRNTTKATDDQIASAEDWITLMQAQKVFADTDLRVALATLTGATKNVAGAQDLMGLAMDTARAKTLPLATVADALAKAHSGNTRALLALIPGLKQAGEKTIDFATAQERLNTQVRGQADAWAATDAGKLESLNLQWGEMQETVGAALLPALTQVVDVVAGLFDWFNQLSPGTQQLIIDAGVLAGGLVAVSSAFGAVKNAVQVLGLTAGSTMPWITAIGLAVGGLYALLSDGDDTTVDLSAATIQFAESLKTSTAQLLANADAILRLRGTIPDTTVGLTTMSDAVVNALNAENAGTGDELIATLGTLGLTAQDAAAVMIVLGDRTETGSYRMGELAEAIFGITDAQFGWLRVAKESTYEQQLAAEGMTESEAAALGYTRELFNQRDAIMKVERGANGLSVQLESSDVNVRAMAESFVDQARGASDLTKELVTNAEAQAAASGMAGDAVTIYLNYIAAAAGLDEEHRKLALDLSASAAAGAELPPVLEETSDAMDVQTTAANSNSAAVRELAGAFSGLLGALDDRDAVRNMETAFDDVKKKADDAVEAGNAAVVAQQEADKARANGAKDAAEKQQAADQAMQDYEESTRASAQAQDDLTREVIAFGDEVDGIPPEKITEILALIDEGKRDEAEAALHDLERSRRVMFSAVLDPSTDKITIGSLGNVHLSARGRYVDRPMITAVGEGNRREVILPLENSGRMAELLADPRVLGPVTSALPAPRVASAQSARIMAPAAGGFGRGGDTYVHISAGAVVSDRELTEMIADGLSTAARRTGSDVTTRRRAPV